MIYLETTGLKYEIDLNEDLEENKVQVYSYRYYNCIGDDECSINSGFKLS